MYYVYILRSKKKDWQYIGSTANLSERVKDHNEGNNQSTKHYAPFELAAFVAVQTEKKARELEKYFKTGSGRAVLNKRFL